KRRNRWDKEGELNERQIATEQDHFEDELRMIAQTSTASNESTTKSNVIPQQSTESIVTQTKSNVSKSKWDDDDDGDETTT
ncbi:unnamed protein product, partial [Rotaria magnacalcarata]